MKKQKASLSLLTLAVLLVSCNEKVSPNLKSGATTGDDSGGDGSGASDSFYFRVVNTSPVILNYKLHRTGPGLGWGPSTSNCEIIKKGEDFNHDEYSAEASSDHDSKKFDISCYFEAEELALYHAGFSFAVQASPNSCAFVAYTPFSFFDYKPGDSSTTYRRINCADGTGDADAQALGHAYGTVPTNAKCGELVDYSMYFSTPYGAATEKEVVPAVASNQDLCRFDYSDSGGPNCDIGKITIIETNLTWNTDTLSVDSQETTTKVNCGGKVANCVNGPIREISAASGKTTIRLISQAETDKEYSTEYKLPGLIEDSYATNQKYVNYRRNLANPHIQYGNGLVGGAGYSTYKNAFKSDGTNYNYIKKFVPDLMDFYAGNRMLHLNEEKDPLYPYVDDTALLTEAKAKGYFALPIAAEPFMSVHPNYPINPYYTFHCLDEAYETKARIRMVVRDWDRVLPASSASSELLSDIGESNPTQDNLLRDNYGDSFNDKKDWDDKIPMIRSAGTFSNSDPSTPPTIIWQPTTGFFKTSNFPGAEL